MNGKRILKFSGQGSVYIRCLEPLQEENEQDQELLQPVFSDDNTLESQMTAYISSSPDEVTQPAATSQNVTYSISEEFPVFNNEEEYLYLKMKKYQQHIWKNNLLLVLML